MFIGCVVVLGIVCFYCARNDTPNLPALVRPGSVLFVSLTASSILALRLPARSLDGYVTVWLFLTIGTIAGLVFSSGHAWAGQKNNLPRTLRTRDQVINLFWAFWFGSVASAAVFLQSRVFHSLAEILSRDE